MEINPEQTQAKRQSLRNMDSLKFYLIYGFVHLVMKCGPLWRGKIHVPQFLLEIHTYFLLLGYVNTLPIETGAEGCWQGILRRFVTPVVLNCIGLHSISKPSSKSQLKKPKEAQYRQKVPNFHLCLPHTESFQRNLPICPPTI